MVSWIAALLRNAVTQFTKLIKSAPGEKILLGALFLVDDGGDALGDNGDGTFAAQQGLSNGQGFFQV